MAYMAIHSIHLPHPALPEFYAMYPQDMDPDYVGTLTQMDVQIGRLRQFLKDEGLAENTLLWFTSDNGPHCNGAFQDICGGIRTGRSTGGLRGCKSSTWEGGVRVPGIVEWPAVIKEHLDATIPGTAWDILPTLMDILSVEHDHPDWPLDGQSLLPLFRSEPVQRRPFGIVQGKMGAWIDNEMKLAVNLVPGQGCVYQSPYSSEKDSAGPFLYNLTEDPTESVDLKKTFPEVYQQMLTAYNGWLLSIERSTTDENGCATQHDGPSPPPSPVPPTPPSPSPPSACAITEETGSCGNDLRKVSVPDKESCCGLCVDDSECTVAVFDGRHCRVKDLTQPCATKAGHWMINVTDLRTFSRASLV